MANRSASKNCMYNAGRFLCSILELVALEASQTGRPRRLSERARLVDFARRTPNNRPMARPEAARRIKSYSAATGYVYQYYFYEVQKTRRGLAAGTEYVYMVSVDRQKVFPLRIFVRHGAVEKWAKNVGREMTGTEEYAVAKMRLFQAFDEVDDLAIAQLELLVDESNLEALLAQLDI
jgi:hypothetical protein